MSHSARALVVAAVMALVAITGLFLVMKLLSAPARVATPTPLLAVVESPTPFTPSQTATHTPTVTREEIKTPTALAIASVDGVPIYQVTLDTAYALDTVLNRLTGQPAPSKQHELDMLINESLVLNAAGLAREQVASDEVRRRIQELESQWGLDSGQLVSSLESSGLNQEILGQRVSRLILIERSIEIVNASDPDSGFEAWLGQARQQAEIEVYLTEEAVAGLTTTTVPSTTGNTPQAVKSGHVSTTIQTEPDIPAPTAQEERTGNLSYLAPDFTLDSSQGIPITLGDYRGKSQVVLVFYRGST